MERGGGGGGNNNKKAPLSPFLIYPVTKKNKITLGTHDLKKNETEKIIYDKEA